MSGQKPVRVNVSITDPKAIDLLLRYQEQLGSSSYAAIIGQALRRKLPPLEREPK